MFTHDLVYAITTDGCGRLFLESHEGVVLASTPVGQVDDDTHEAFVRRVTELLDWAECV
jgi:hypothetical protein